MMTTITFIVRTVSIKMIVGVIAAAFLFSKRSAGSGSMSNRCPIIRFDFYHIGFFWVDIFLFKLF